MKNNKILLSENSEVYNDLIAYENLKSQNGTTLLTMLDKMGLTFERVEDWNDVIEAVTKDYPKANLHFNLNANGIYEQYQEAEAFFLQNRSVMSFTILSDNEIEAIKESSRIYADTPAQIEAHGLFQNVVDSLTRLKEMGVRIEADELYQVSRVFAGGDRHTPLQIDKKNLATTLMKLN